MAHSLPVKIRRTEFASSGPDELREVIDRGFGSRLQLAVPRRRGWRATVSQVDAGYFTSTDTRLPADLTFTNDGHDDSFVIDTLLDGDISTSALRVMNSQVASGWLRASGSRVRGGRCRSGA